MENKKFDSVEHEIIYKKMMNYCNKSNIEIAESNVQNNLQNYDNSSIDIMRNYKEVHAHRLISSHRKYIGNAIVFGKKVVRKLLKWYINPITEQQTIFNSATLETIEKAVEKTNALKLENENQSAKIAEVESQLEKITELESQLGRITELENQLGRIAELESQISRITQLERQLSKIIELEDNFKKINGVFKLNLFNEGSFFEKQSYSQSGEDTIVAYIFYVLGIKNEEVMYLDLGANHAKELSNTYYFYEKGAKGVLIEANPKLVQELSFYRHNDVILNCIVSEKSDEELDFYVLSGDGLSTPDKSQALEICKINPNIAIDKVIKVKSVTVNQIIEKYFGGISPNFISIDIEGKDLEVIKSIDLDKYRPLVIIVETIEYRPHLSINIKKREVLEYLITKDYVEYAFTGINSIFIDAKYMKSISQEE